MWIPNGLRNAISDFLLSLPNIQGHNVLHSFVLSANLENNFLNQLNFNLSPMDFFQHYISVSLGYGSHNSGGHALEALLLKGKERTGQEGQVFCNKLLDELREYINTYDQYDSIVDHLQDLYQQHKEETDAKKQDEIERILENVEKQRHKLEKDSSLISIIHTSIIEKYPFPILGFTIKNKHHEAQHIINCKIIIQHKPSALIELIAPQNKILKPLTIWDIMLPCENISGTFHEYSYSPQRVIQVGTVEPIVIDMRFSFKYEDKIFHFCESEQYQMKVSFVTDGRLEIGSELLNI